MSPAADRRRRGKGAAPAAGRDPAIRYGWADTALGRLLVAATDRGVCLVALRERGALAALERWTETNEPDAVLRRDPAAVREAAAQLAGYAGGSRERFDLVLDLRGTSFQRSVWRGLCAIPYGETRTYGELAAAIGRPGAARAVGTAAGRNPVPLAVPCHRLLASGALGGFGAGLATKRKLLRLERIPVPGA